MSKGEKLKIGKVFSTGLRMFVTNKRKIDFCRPLDE